MVFHWSPSLDHGAQGIRSMKIHEAKKRVKAHRTIAIILIIVSALFAACSILKSLYFAMEADASPFSSISNVIRQIIYFIYEQTQFVSWVWEQAPVTNPKELNTSGNFGFLLVACCGALGLMMWDSASDLASRIRQTIRKVEEIGWEQSLLIQQGLSRGEKPDMLQINIELDQNDQWYKRPIGLILIGAAIAVLGQWVNLKFGLIK